MGITKERKNNWESRLKTTRSFPSEHHPGEKQFTGEKRSKPYRRGGACKKGGKRKQGANGAMRSTVEKSDARGAEREAKGGARQSGIERYIKARKEESLVVYISSCTEARQSIDAKKQLQTLNTKACRIKNR